MTYYLVIHGMNESLMQFDRSIVGESSFDKFWPEAGFEVLMKIVDKHSHMLSNLSIMTERGKKLSIEEFLNEIKGLKIVRR